MDVLRHFGWLVICAVVGWAAFIAGLAHATVPQESLGAALGFSGAFVGTAGAVLGVLFVARYERRKSLEPIALLALRRVEQDLQEFSAFSAKWTTDSGGPFMLSSLVHGAEAMSRGWIERSDELRQHCGQLSLCIGPYFALAAAMREMVSQSSIIQHGGRFDRIVREQRLDGTAFHMTSDGCLLSEALKDVLEKLGHLRAAALRYT